MGNNKRSRSKRGEAKAPQAAVSNSSKAEETRAFKGFTSAQFSGLLMIGLGISYIVEYGRVLKDGTDSTACAEYVIQEEGSTCSELDTVMIRAKYYGAFVTLLSLISTMRTCWTNEPLLFSLNAILCISPLWTSAGALFWTRHLLTAAATKFSMMAVVLFVTTAKSVYSAEKLAKPTVRGLNTLQDVSLLSLLLVNAKDVVALVGGVEGFVNVDSGAVSPAAEALVSFLVVDKLTMIATLMFAICFLDELQKRSMLLFMAVIQLVNWYFYLPKLADDLLDGSTAVNIAFGSALLSGIASLAPKLSWK